MNTFFCRKHLFQMIHNIPQSSVQAYTVLHLLCHAQALSHELIRLSVICAGKDFIAHSDDTIKHVPVNRSRTMGEPYRQRTILMHKLNTRQMIQYLFVTAIFRLAQKLSWFSFAGTSTRSWTNITLRARKNKPITPSTATDFTYAIRSASPPKKLTIGVIALAMAVWAMAANSILNTIICERCSGSSVT